ncbi:30S ribosomal protein S17 [Candidatus Woesearchaeota archaeon]|nr:30S ribosomal protein S17 [Candidatus Woesearchaeota archaeon]
MKTIGIDVKVPKNKCEDRQCPFHGIQRVRGKLMQVEVIKKNVSKTATVSFHHFHYIPKYERYEKKQSKLKVHNPLCIDANVGDIVMIGETKPISKTKHFVIIEVIKK